MERAHREKRGVSQSHHGSATASHCVTLRGPPRLPRSNCVSLTEERVLEVLRDVHLADLPKLRDGAKISAELVELVVRGDAVDDREKFDQRSHSHSRSPGSGREVRRRSGADQNRKATRQPRRSRARPGPGSPGNGTDLPAARASPPPPPPRPVRPPAPLLSRHRLTRESRPGNGLALVT